MTIILAMSDSSNIIDLGESTVMGSQAASHKKYAKKKLLAIEAAAKVFADKGFHGATTQDIAQAMGIQQGSLSTGQPVLLLQIERAGAARSLRIRL